MRAADRFNDDMMERLDGLRDEGLYKVERVIASPQSGEVVLEGSGQAINLCANNYLGLADHPDLIAAGQAALDRYGYGMASVRFICGTQEEHKALEARIARFLRMEDSILYSAVLMPIPVCSRPFWGRKTRSSRMRSTTPVSLMGCACARRSACAMPIRIWRILRCSCRQPPRRGTV